MINTTNETGALAMVRRLLETRLTPAAQGFLLSATEEIKRGINQQRFAQLFSLASRHVRPRIPLSPSAKECTAANEALTGWNPETWQVLEALRVALLLSRPDISEASFVTAYEHCFQFADEGELCALYRALPLLPAGERFAWRASEGCRSNMRTVFDSIALDSPYPVKYFNDIAWHQMIIKSVFVEAPLWRVYGLDTRLSPELARIALDLVEERRSAGRPIQPQLWLCLGKNGGERGLNAIKQALTAQDPQSDTGRRAALLALARAGELTRAKSWLGNSLGELESTFAQAHAGDFGQNAFGRL